MRRASSKRAFAASSLFARRSLSSLVADEKSVPVHQHGETRIPDCSFGRQRVAPQTDATGIGSTHQSLRDSRPLVYRHIAEVWAVDQMPVDTFCDGRVFFSSTSFRF
jgi:hypothetical protein